jgi:hypothetical protein
MARQQEDAVNKRKANKTGGGVNSFAIFSHCHKLKNLLLQW